jgi:hypothetical protein
MFIVFVFLNYWGSCAPNGLAHLPPVLAKQQIQKTNISYKVPLRTYAEGGQVEPVLGRHLFS